MAEVEVETATGKTTVLKMTACVDVGVICSRLAVDGQMYGGLAQGIGFALSEEFEDIKEHSTMTGAGFPFIKDIPDDLELHYQQTPRPNGTYRRNGLRGAAQHESARGHHKRDLQCLRGAHHKVARAAGEGARRFDGQVAMR